MQTFNVNLEVTEETLPEGQFYKATTHRLGEELIGLARSQEIAIAICLDKFSDSLRNSFYDKKRAEY